MKLTQKESERREYFNQTAVSHTNLHIIYTYIHLASPQVFANISLIAYIEVQWSYVQIQIRRRYSAR